MDSLKHQYPSFGQERLWFIQKLNPESLAYNVGIAIVFEGRLDVNALYDSCELIIRRHESLRMTFQEIDGKPIIKMSDDCLRFEKIIIRASDIGVFRDFNEFCQSTFRRTLDQKFDLEKGPLIRHALFEYSANLHLFIVNFHHIIFDGWSSAIYVKELFFSYKLLSDNKEVYQDPMRNPYVSFIEYQREYMQGEKSADLLKYWKDNLRGVVPLVFPSDRARVHSGIEICCYKFYFPDNFYQNIKNTAQEKDTTIFYFLFVSFYILLSRYSGQKDFVMGVPVHGREYDDFSDTIGFFVNTLPIRLKIDDQLSFKKLLEEFKTTMNGAFKHQEIRLENLVNELKFPRILNRDPVFQVMFGFNNFSFDNLGLDDLNAYVLDVEGGRMPCDISVEVSNNGGKFNALFKYDSNIFNEKTIKNIGIYWLDLIQNSISNFEIPVKFLNFIPKEELQKILVDWNDTEKIYDKNRTFINLFEDQVDKTPDNVAIYSTNEKITYKKLNERVNRLANFLREKGVAANTHVAIACERSIEMIVALLGVLKAGGAFVPLDPTYPTERLIYSLQDTQTPIVITQKNLLDKIPKTKSLIVCVDEDQKIKQFSSENPISLAIPSDMAYVIYTSGSTGRPKGVMIQHSSLHHFSIAQNNMIDVSEKDKVLQFFSINFDASIAEWSLAFSRGASLCLIASKNQCVGVGLEEMLKFYGITIAFLTPSVLSTISFHEVPSLKTLVLGGESCAKSLLLNLDEKIKIIHQYGPTEATVCASFFYHNNQYPTGTIGRPIQNTKLYILDENLQPVPPGVRGELYIAGPGLAKGYLNCPELTTMQFISNPFINYYEKKDDLTKIYKTGDMCRYLEDGNIEYFGRADDQVKIRGFRIELGEIENALKENAEIKDAAVVVKDHNNEKHLVAYIVLKKYFIELEFSDVFLKKIKNNLTDRLPYYMIPYLFIFLKDTPLTASGKLDRNHFPGVDFSIRMAKESNSVKPRTSIEKKLMKIWSEVLGVESSENYFCIHDDFFEAGGNSLLAAQLISKLNKSFCCDLSLADLFQNATVENVAKLIEKTTAYMPNDSVLVPIRKQGSGKPIFCIHSAGGNVLCYRSLLRFLPENQPVYGLQSLGMIPHHQPQSTVEEMAITYARAIRDLQPLGPYKLLGWSTGGIIAFEIAHQLEKENNKIEEVILIDTRLLRHYPKVPSDEAIMKIILNKKEYLSLNFKDDSIDSSLFQTKNREEKIQILYKKLLNFSIFRDSMKKEDVLRLLNVMLLNVEASYLYEPKFRLESPVKILIASQDFNAKVDDQYLGWKPYVKKTMASHIVDSNHYSILESINMDLLNESMSNEYA